MTGGIIDTSCLTMGPLNWDDGSSLREIGTNLLGSIQVVRSALPHLRAQQQARIIQISTYGGQAALPGGSMYHAPASGAVLGSPRLADIEPQKDLAASTDFTTAG